MKKIFLSADIEGTAGIVHWDETETGKPLYDRFARQMTREVAAACQGAMAAGAGEILVKDAHDTGRNLDPEQLPPCARIFRGWGRDPYSMMGGLDRDFDGVVFTGYHSAADTDGNPLAHTMNLGIDRLTINGETAPELLINSLTAAYMGVPVRFVSGDEALCRWMHRMCDQPGRGQRGGVPAPGRGGGANPRRGGGGASQAQGGVPVPPAGGVRGGGALPPALYGPPGRVLSGGQADRSPHGGLPA